jgi:hypothetical protein
MLISRLHCGTAIEPVEEAYQRATAAMSARWKHVLEQP